MSDILDEFNGKYMGTLMCSELPPKFFFLFLGVDFDVEYKARAAGWNLKTYWLEHDGHVTWYFCDEKILRKWLKGGMIS